MHINELHDYSGSDADEAVAKSFLSEDRKKAIKAEVGNIIDEELDQMEDYARDHISSVAASRAYKFLERVLAGDNDAGMTLLGDANGSGRYKTNDGEPWASVIHGTVFETGGIKLRRQIVEAHADLIESERIKDLESIVEGLTNQVNKLERDLREARERLR
ncbi:hypothetical protein [Rosistilla oblonga]|uniref:hypothetical protein n=1 Tax=Rosistilla oblonga TaxID=2527990 RepID=UPI003A970ED4